MKLKLILTAASLGVALALPSVSSAAPPAPTLQDSVVLTGAPASTTFQSPEGIMFGHIIWELHATSGPNGENPSGLVRFSNGPANFGGPVTCLNVSGDTATITFVSDPSIISQPPINAEGNITVTVTDDQPDTFASGGQASTPTECPQSPPDTSGVEQLSNGDITVVDAQAPTAKAQCKNGGWKEFGFKNQGRCVAFVILSKVCDAFARHGHHLKFCPPRPPIAPRP
jgi:hypothetical protein